LAFKLAWVKIRASVLYPIHEFNPWWNCSMPIYEYQCQACNEHLEALQKISDVPLLDCPHCGKPALKKKVSAAAFRLKGGGWYETDFKTGNKKNLVSGGDSAGSGDKASSGAAESKSADSRASDSKSGDSKASDSKSGDSKASGSKSGDSKASDSKSGDSKKTA
jgi:putative FmdB family regulatory protein